MAGEVTDPRVKAILLGGGAVAAGAPFVAGAMSNQQRPIDRARASRMAKTAPRASSALGRLAGPAGAAASMFMPSGNMAGPEATMLRPNETYGDPVLQRSMFGGQPPQAAGTGITSGLETTPEQEAEMEGTLAEIAGGLQSMNDDIDNAEDYVGIMNAIRGDDQSIDQRRSELAGYIGKEDAGKTPESALTLIQPSLTLLDSAEQGSQEEGGAIADDGIMSMLGELGGQGAMQGAADAMQGGQPMQAPGQGEAMARMAMGEQPVMRKDGTTPTPLGGEMPSGMSYAAVQNLQSLIPQAKTYEELLPKYETAYGDTGKAYELNPYISGLNLAAAVANAGEGELLSSILAPETIKAVSDPILQMAQAKAAGAGKAKAAALTAAQTSADKYQDRMFDITKIGAELGLTPEKFETQKLEDGTVIQWKPSMIGKKVSDGKGGEVDYEASVVGKSGVKYNQVATGDGRIAILNPYTDPKDPTKNPVISYIGTKKGNFSQVTTDNGDILNINNDTGTFKNIYKGSGNIIGDMNDGFARITRSTDANGLPTFDVQPVPIPDGKGGFVNHPGDMTDLQRNANEFAALSTILQNPEEDYKRSEAFVTDSAKLKVLTKALFKDETTTEFERLLSDQEASIRSKAIAAGETPAEADRLAAEFGSTARTNFITKAGTVTSSFNANAELNDASSKALVKRVEEQADQVGKLQTISTQANQVIATVDGFEGGRLGASRASLLGIIKDLGIENIIEEKFDIEGGLDQWLGGNYESAQVQQALGEQIVVALAGAFPGNLNQSEIDILIRAAPGIGKTPEANKLIADTMRFAASRERLISKAMNDYITEETAEGTSPTEMQVGLIEVQAKMRNEDVMLKNPEFIKLQKRLAEQEAQLLSMPYENQNGSGAELDSDDVQRHDDIQQYPDVDSFLQGYNTLSVNNPTLYPAIPPINDPQRDTAISQIKQNFRFLKGLTKRNTP